MSQEPRIDIVLGSFGVCVYWYNGTKESNSSCHYFTDLPVITSKRHLIFRIMRSLRDCMLGVPKKVIAKLPIRIVYSGECTFAEPIHIEKIFDAPTIVDGYIKKQVISEILTTQADRDTQEYALCGYLLDGISSRGFSYEDDLRVIEATFHGTLSYCDKELRLWVERTLFLAGAVAKNIRHRVQTSMIPSVLLDMLINKSKGFVLVYEVGAIQSLVSKWGESGLQATRRANMGFLSSPSRMHQAELINDIVSWCVNPKDSVQVVFVMDASQYNNITTELDSVMHEVQERLPAYTLGAMAYVLDHSNPADMYQLFSKVYPE